MRRLDRRSLRLGGSRSGLRFTNAGLALKLAHFFFQRVAKVTGHLPEFSGSFAEHAGQLRQLLRAEDNQGHDKKDDQMWHAQHGR